MRDSKPLSGLLAEPGTKESIFEVSVSDLQSGLSISADGKITGTLKYLSGDNAITNVWGPGNFMYLKFTLPEGVTYSDVKVGIVPSEGSGLVTLDADLDGIMKVTDKDKQMFKMRVEKNGQIYEEGYDLSGLTCETA